MPLTRSGQTAIRAPTWPSPEITVASATGCSASIEASTPPTCGCSVADTACTNTDTDPPQVSPTANASESE